MYHNCLYHLNRFVIKQNYSWMIIFLIEIIMNKVTLTKKSTESDLKRYFTAVLELSKEDNKFPVNLDEVWPLVYAEKGKAVRALRKDFFENEDFKVFAQNGEKSNGKPVDNYFLSLSCLEYFIARKVRPVFEVYRQVFNNFVKNLNRLSLGLRFCTTNLASKPNGHLVID